jgi:hypothetical protein
MFGYTWTFVRNWLIVLAVLVTGATVAFGYNSIDGSFNLFVGFGAVIELLGGLPTVGALLIITGILVAAFFGFRHIARTDYKSRANAIGIVGTLILLGAAFISFSWIKFDDSFWPTLGALVFTLVLVTAATAIVTHRTKKVNTAS